MRCMITPSSKSRKECAEVFGEDGRRGQDGGREEKAERASTSLLFSVRRPPQDQSSTLLTLRSNPRSRSFSCRPGTV